MLSSGLRGGTGWKQGEGKQASGDFNFHDSVCGNVVLSDGLYNYHIGASKGKHLFFFSQKSLYDRS